jgi:hypothetical protein
MFYVFFMFIDSATAWRWAGEAGKSLTRLTVVHLLPLAALGCVAEGYGLMHWGRSVGDYGARQIVPLADVLRYEGARFALALLMVLLVACVLRVVANTFHARNGFLPALTVAVFGCGPIFLLRVADMFSVAPPWLTWAVGAILSAAVLYQGIPRVMRADPTHAMGLYMAGAMLVVMFSGVMQLAVPMLLEEQLLPTAREVGFGTPVAAIAPFA